MTRKGARNMNTRVITHSIHGGKITLCADGKHDTEKLSGVYYGVERGIHWGRCDACPGPCWECGTSTDEDDVCATHDEGAPCQSS